MTETPIYAKLLKDTGRILEHQKEIAVLKGENFNVFSILKLESKENGTHSAFLGELLNPKGSHNFGSTFLQLFLQQIKDERINIASAQVILEYSIGANNHLTKTGGRVDIYIKDRINNTICIENKIYASDQSFQLKRYANHNYERNKVFYLTLNGEEPSDGSKDDLKVNEHYYCISYRTTIIEWLEACLKEATDQPIVRESIKQYIILLKKLTNQLTDSKMENEIKDMIKSNYLSARTISDTIEIVEIEYATRYLNEIGLKITETLNTENSLWSYEISDNLSVPWSRLNIFHKHWTNGIRVQLQGESRIHLNRNKYGLIAHKDHFNRQFLIEKLKKSGHSESDWKDDQYWVLYNYDINFGDIGERSKLFDNKQREELVHQIANKMIEICRLCDVPLRNFPTIQSVDFKDK
ncbi:hypothetical protein CJ739_3620 [Mariniflexile rhizosphaerae]|uniref:PDDEXK-like family protein n=1 Tax=unclassified Mariniflexile TaxID=2643887 RepID=UPI000CB51D10|nr:PD-(D/E)XK nuclease family protein [Mariniflexile sp. TRM1-10]AXP82682.1 hypothetical protein CJ739_3620 [Mariniflexile sp. TRM1-10]PLB18914.1 MAG: PDDEXK_4 domain containing protein [Flavobacteriaceae bacterium FS1-H7996/R]